VSAIALGAILNIVGLILTLGFLVVVSSLAGLADQDEADVTTQIAGKNASEAATNPAENSVPSNAERKPENNILDFILNVVTSKLLSGLAALVAILSVAYGGYRWLLKRRSRESETQTVNGPQTNIEGDVHGPVLSGQFQGPVTFEQSAPPPPHTPIQKPSRVQHFTGREGELASLLADLQPGRVVTLCGPGGIGKITLAAEAIWTLAPESDPPERFPDGIIFHTFYHQPQSALALEAIARAYGEDPRPSPAEAARRALSGRCALIVLDGAEAADDLDAVLAVAGDCGVLITSRRHQDAPAEWKDLPPLPLEKAVQLLEAWGGDFATDEATTSRICELLGRLPLAIFLAGRYMAERRQQASDYLDWLETTPLDALDLGERQHKSVPLLMERSLEQVAEQSQAALGVAGILALEPFDSQLVAIGLDVDQQHANHFLGELVDYGMLLRPDASYQVTHSLLHTYARERLVPVHEALSRLAEHYTVFAREESELGLSGYARLDSHRAHILSLQSACLAAGEWSDVRRLTWAINDYLDLQGHWTDRGAAVEMGLEAARADGSRRDEGAFLNFLGLTKAALGDPRRAIEFYEQQLDIAREIGDRRGEGADLYNISLSLEKLGKRVQAIKCAKTALQIYEQIESPYAEHVWMQLDEWQEK